MVPRHSICPVDNNQPFIFCNLAVFTVAMALGIFAVIVLP